MCKEITRTVSAKYCTDEAPEGMSTVEFANMKAKQAIESLHENDDNFDPRQFKITIKITIKNITITITF